MAGTLRSSTVATSIAFPQAPEFDEWLATPGNPEWLSKSTIWVKRLTHLMKPAVIVTYGGPPFRHLVGRRKAPGAECTTWQGIPLVGTNHLSRASYEVSRRAMRFVRNVVNGK
ncbi:MAG: hypothetical protein F4029_17460 [Gammaproteobacteria bacterium]|nr:hypothetical protein [Gammaproteobacteria bacterium]MYK48006.1 hypothetical protein [Gammaproteobacteria bacterium]